MNPTLTVAMPTCDGARHIGEALTSILDQRDADFDLVVCDDASEDETLDIARRLAGDRARIVASPTRSGLAGNWNRCVAESPTDLVAIFHQDDVMRPGHLAAHLAIFRDHPALGMACGEADVIDGEGRSVPETVVGRGRLGPADRIFAAGTFVAELSASNPVRCSAVTLRREVHQSLGGFDPRYRYAVDWEFWLRLAQRHEVAWLAGPTVAIRWHPASETHRFKSGTDDLDEQAALLDALQTRCPERDRRLARAYLNRAYDAAQAGRGGLLRDCLRKAVARNPAVIGTIAGDPRLAARLVAGLLGRNSGGVATPSRPPEDLNDGVVP